MKKSLFAFLLLFIGATTVFAKNATTIKGKVIGGPEKYELIGANVFFKDKSIGTTTDIDGRFILSSDHPLPWTLKVTYIGYVDQEVTLDDPNTFLSVHLIEDLNPPQKVVILPIPRPIHHKRKEIKGRVIDKENNTPLIAANLFFKGSKNNTGTITDLDGSFELPLARSLPCVLVIEYVGYIRKELLVESVKKPLVIEMAESSQNCRDLLIRGNKVTKGISYIN